MECRTNTQLIFPLGEQNANGVVIAFDIFPISGGESIQGLFAFRNSASNTVTIHAQLASDRRVNVWYNSAGASHAWNNIITSTGALTNGNL